jgi:hypothetical protein
MSEPPPATPVKGVFTPHFSSQFTFDAKGRSVVVEQDSEGDLIARAKNVAVCPQGFREDNPDFGIPQLLFRNVPLDVSAVQNEIARWADLSLSVTESEGVEAALRKVLVEVTGG